MSVVDHADTCRDVLSDIVDFGASIPLQDFLARWLPEVLLDKGEFKVVVNNISSRRIG